MKMPLKRMSEFKRDDYSYESPDGDTWEITIVQTDDRKYVEIKKEEETIQWDVEMLLDVADAVRAAIRKPAQRKPHQLQKPNIIDHRQKEENSQSPQSPSEAIQASVEESKSIGIDSSVAPVQSFSPEKRDPEKRDIAAELQSRKTKTPGVIDPDKMIRRT